MGVPPTTLICFVITPPNKNGCQVWKHQRNICYNRNGNALKKNMKFMQTEYNIGQILVKGHAWLTYYFLQDVWPPAESKERLQVAIYAIGFCNG